MLRLEASKQIPHAIAFSELLASEITKRAPKASANIDKPSGDMMRSKIEINLQRQKKGHMAVLDDHGCVSVFARFCCVSLVATAGFGCGGGSEGLLEITNDVVNVFCAY